MKVQKVIRAEGEFAKINEDIKNEDKLTIKDAGQIISGDYGDRYVFKVGTRNGDKNISFNQTSMNNIIEAYGDDTDNWVGKTATAYVIKQMVGDSLKNVCYLVGEGWVMNDSGKFVKGASPVTSTADINPDDIPF